MEGWESYYFVSTAYSGARAEIYGGELVARVAWAVARGDSGGTATSGPDFVLVAKGMYGVRYVKFAEDGYSTLFRFLLHLIILFSSE